MRNDLADAPESSQCDFLLTHDGQSFHVQPLTLPAQHYAHEFLPRDAKHWTDKRTAVPVADLADVLNGIRSANLSIDCDPCTKSGRVRTVLLTYLAGFTLSLVLFLRGHHSLAFVLLIGVWAVLSFWLHKGGRR